MARIDWNTDRIMGRFEQRATHALDVVTEEIQDEGQANARVRSGAYRASFYRVTPTGSDYAERVAEARSKNKAVTFTPQVQPEQRPDTVAGGNGVAVSYGGILEWGLESGRAGDATLTTAASGAQQRLAEALRD